MPGTRAGGLAADAGDEHVQRHRVLRKALVQHRAPALPRREQREHDAADGEREPAAVGNLERVRREKGDVDRDQRQRRSRAQPGGSSSTAASCTTKISSESISIASVTAMPYAAARLSELRKPSTSSITAHEQHPVDERDVDLADLALGGVQDRQARAIAHLDRLRASAKTRPRSPPATRSPSRRSRGRPAAAAPTPGASR